MPKEEVLVKHPTLEGFQRALETKNHKRLFVYTTPYDYQTSMQLAFMDELERLPHKLELNIQKKDKETLARVNAICRLAKILVDGRIEISGLTKEVYNLFETPYTNDPAEIKGSYLSWLNAAEEQIGADMQLNYALRATPRRKNKVYDIFDVILSLPKKPRIHFLTFLDSEYQSSASSHIIETFSQASQPDRNKPINHTPRLDHPLKSQDITSTAYQWFVDLPSLEPAIS